MGKLSSNSKTSIPPEKPRIEDVLANDLYVATGIRPVREFKFASSRKWAFDLAYPVEKVAIEISGRYHLTHKRFRQDCERNNFARMRGWEILVYPASCVAAKSRRAAIVEQIHRFLCGITDDDLDSEILTKSVR